MEGLQRSVLQALASFLQVILLALQSTSSLLKQYFIRSRRRRGVLRALSSSGITPSRRRRQRWHALAGLRFKRRYWVYPRSMDWWENYVLCVWGDEQWLLNFRMDRGTFMEIVSVVAPHLERQTTRMRHPVDPAKRVAVAIWYLANTDTFREVSHLFGIGLSTVAGIVHEFSRALEKTLFATVVCPGTEIGKIMDGFGHLGMPHCIGAIDGTHIPIRAPGGRVNEYGNRKNYCPILIQGTVDNTGRFIDAEVGHSGRTNDAFVFSNSNIYCRMDAGLFVPGNPTVNLNGVNIPALILGDGAYPLRPWLMSPYRKPREPFELHFNKVHSRARNVVERVFGRLKARWRVLSSRLAVHVDSVSTIATACIILHNICEMKGHEVHLEWQEHDTILVPEEEEKNPKLLEKKNKKKVEEGRRVRDAVAKYIYANRRR